MKLKISNHCPITKCWESRDETGKLHFIDRFDGLEKFADQPELLAGKTVSVSFTLPVKEYAYGCKIVSEPTTSKTISLIDYNNMNPVTYLWICGVGCPAGQDYNHNTESNGEDYCDLNELIGELGLWELEGEVIDGQWQWNGNGSPTDTRGNTIYNVKAS